MNANELAQYLEEQMSGWATDLVLREAANMLRQQHTSLISDVDVIERQYKEIQVKDEAIFNSQKQAYNLAMQVQNQKFEIEALKAHPVNPYKAITDTKIEPTVVSYTHPVTEHFEDEPQAEELHEIMQSNAELTDEEIAVIGDKCFGTMSYELWVQTNEFARAILRKAQESDKIESLGTVNIGGVHFRNGKEVK